MILDVNREIKRRKPPKKRTRLVLKRWIRVIILICFIALFAFSFLNILLWNKDNKDTKKVEKDITKDIKVNEIEADAGEDTNINPPEDKDNDYWNYIKMNMLDVNFSDLKKKNSDTKAWVKVEGTNINYPVVQRSDNEYYLNHSYDKSKNNAGWVFLDFRNNLDVLDKNTIIYAHGRVDTTMFGSLKNILKSNWYENKNNYIIKFATDKYTSLWQVFSVYTIKAESYYITTDFSSNNEFKEFATTLKGRSKVKFSADVNENDKIITLSTCRDSKGNRVVMHAKLIKLQKKELSGN